MTISIEESSITGGTAGAIFDNDRGALRISKLQVNDVKSAALIATANAGTSMLENSTITRKNSLIHDDITALPPKHI